MNGREHLHELIDRLPERKLPAAEGLLKNLFDEVLTPEELAEIDEAGEEIKAGNWYTLEQIKKENGL